MFTWTVVSSGNERYISDMYMDGAIIGASVSNGRGGYATSSSNVVFIHCETGNRVYIQCGSENSCMPRPDDHGLVTFAGFLVAADTI